MTPDQWDIIYDMLDHLELLSKEASQGQGMRARLLQEPIKILKKRTAEVRYGAKEEESESEET